MVDYDGSVAENGNTVASARLVTICLFAECSSMLSRY